MPCPWVLGLFQSPVRESKYMGRTKARTLMRDSRENYSPNWTQDVRSYSQAYRYSSVCNTDSVVIGREKSVGGLLAAVFFVVRNLDFAAFPRVHITWVCFHAQELACLVPEPDIWKTIQLEISLFSGVIHGCDKNYIQTQIYEISRYSRLDISGERFTYSPPAFERLL